MEKCPHDLVKTFGTKLTTHSLKFEYFFLPAGFVLMTEA